MERLLENLSLFCEEQGYTPEEIKEMMEELCWDKEIDPALYLDFAPSAPLKQKAVTACFPHTATSSYSVKTAASGFSYAGIQQFPQRHYPKAMRFGYWKI